MAGDEVSRTLALAWGLAAAPQRGPKRELSLERIVDAAIRIADAEGLQAVTMQRVAQTFEFSTMALYRYVATKHDLHQLMLDTAMSRALEPLASADWREGFAEFLRGLVAGYRRHPWVLDIALTPDIHLMPGQIRAADLGLRAMRGMRVPPETKLGVLMLLSAFARGHAAVEREVLAGIDVGAETRELIEEAVGIAEFPGVGPLVQSGAYFGDDAAGAGAGSGSARASSTAAVDAAAAAAAAEAEADQILGFAAQVLIAGLDATLASPPESPENPESPGDPGRPGTADGAPSPVPLTPQEAYAAAEARLIEHREQRKLAQRRLRELEREEAAVQKARDRAKELAKAHARLDPGS